MQGSGSPGPLCMMVSLKVHLYYRRSRGFQQGQEGHRGSCKKKKKKFPLCKKKMQNSGKVLKVCELCATDTDCVNLSV